MSFGRDIHKKKKKSKSAPLWWLIALTKPLDRQKNTFIEFFNSTNSR